MRLKLKRLKSWLKCPCKQETLKVLGPLDNFIISLQTLNKCIVISSKNLLNLALWEWDAHTPALFRASASIRWWQWVSSKIWQSGQGFWSILSVVNVEWKSPLYLLILPDLSPKVWMGTSVGDQQSPAFRKEVADTENQWSEKSYLSLSLSSLSFIVWTAENKGEAYTATVRAVPHCRHKNNHSVFRSSILLPPFTMNYHADQLPLEAKILRHVT